MADDVMNNNTPDLSSVLGELLANKELMAKISEISASAKPSPPPPEPDSTEKAESASATAPSIDSLLSNPDIMAKLPEVISVIKPLMSGGKAEVKSNGRLDRRMGLLMAMKPYLSPKRCEAIDYITRMSKLAETVKGLKI